MQRTVGAEADLVLADGEVTGVVAFKIFAQDFVGAVAHSLTQRFANADALAGDSDRHGLSCRSDILRVFLSQNRCPLLRNTRCRRRLVDVTVLTILAR